jgi:hypothetical protein
MPDLVIRDARIVDGTGAESFHGDVAVTGGRIDAVGRVTGKGDREVDAGGRVVSPGFIDLHTHYDCQLFWDRHATPSPWHGVTTVVMGNCGFTLAPCRPSDRHTIMRLLSFVEGMPLDTLQAAIPWQWETYPQYLDAIEQGGLGVNVASFIGHSAIRLHVMGASALEREATSEERAQMAALVPRRRRRRGDRLVGVVRTRTSSPTTTSPRPAGSPRARLLELAAVMRQFDRGVIEARAEAHRRIDGRQARRDPRRTPARARAARPSSGRRSCATFVPDQSRRVPRRGRAPADERREGRPAGRLPAARAPLRLLEGGASGSTTIRSGAPSCRSRRESGCGSSAIRRSRGG